MPTAIGYTSAGLTADMFAYNSSAQVWNGSAFVAWNDANIASYRIALTVVATVGGRDTVTATVPTGTAFIEIRKRGTVGGSTLVWTAAAVASQASVDAVADDVDTLDAIKAKTDLIHPGGVSIVSPVSSSGTIRVSEGFDYSSDGGSAEITITEPAVGAWDADLLAADSFGFYARHSGMDDDLDVTATLNPADGDGLRSFSASILRTDLPSRVGKYKYHVYGHFAATSRDAEIIVGTFQVARGRLVA